jgi:uncharacterized protein
MIAVDANILTYAFRAEMEQHPIAVKRLSELAEGRSRWAITWPSVHEFIRVVTDQRIFQPAARLAEAFDRLAAWRESPSLVLLGETEHHLETLQTISRDALVRGARIHDARIAAICTDHGVDVLWSADRDFSSFPQLKTLNP